MTQIIVSYSAFFMAGVQGFVLDFFSTLLIYFNVMFRKNLRSPFKNSALYCFFVMCRDTFLTERIFRPAPEKRAFRSADEICAPHPTTRALWAAHETTYIRQKKETPPDWMVFLFWLGCRDSNPGNVRVRV